VAQHACARNVWLDVVRDPTQCTLIVRDDGCGFPAKRLQGSPDVRAGMGLFSMRERAALAGGLCEISSQPGVGTTVSARLPLGMQLSSDADL
jgi:signal transduction histidine kinase